MKKHFGLYHAGHGETVCIVEMDDQLLEQDGYIIDHATVTLRPIKNGGMWTLIPTEDPTVMVLRRIKTAYESITQKPTLSMHGMTSKMDALFETIGLLFNEVTYHVVENPEDLSLLINPMDAPEGYEPKTVKESVLGDMLHKAVMDAKDESTDEDKMVEKAIQDASENPDESGTV